MATLAAGVVKQTPKQRRAAKQRREEWAAYMHKHRSKLEKVIQAGVNCVLTKRPPDPWTALLEQLRDHTKEGLAFSHFRCWPSTSGGVCTEVVAAVRGAKASTVRVELTQAMVARALACVNGEDAAEAEAAPPDALAAQLCGKLKGCLAGVHILDLKEMDSRLQVALKCSTPPADELSALRDELDSLMLQSVGSLQDSTVIQAVKASCEWRQLGISAELQYREDLPNWQRQWPEIVLPVLQGATERRRLCLGLTLWAATLQGIAAEELEGKKLVNVDPRAVRARKQEAEEKGAMANAAEAGFDDPDEIPPPDADEFCPPLNAMSFLARLSAALSTRICSEGTTIPAGEDFAASLELLSKGVEQVVPGYVEAEQAAAAETQPAADAGEETDAADADAEPRPVSPDSSEMRANRPVPVPLSVQQQRGSIYGVLFLDADAAFDPETGKYKFAGGEEDEGRSQEETIEYYLSLCKGSPLLRVLVGPLSPRDGSYATGIEQLREKLPPGVVVIDTATGPEGEEPPEAPVSQTEMISPAAAAEEAQDTRTSAGYIRDVTLSPLGLAAQYQKSIAPFACRHGLYDFDSAPAHLPALSSYMDVSLAIPELSRRLLLPKGTAEELLAHVQPLDNQLRKLLAAVYRRKRPAQARELTKAVTFVQFKHGLRELGYAHVDAYAEPLFKFLDTSNNGSISAGELAVLEDIAGPASLSQLDELRLFLSEHQAREKAASRGGTAATDPSSEGGSRASANVSPLKMLWRKMDRNGSGSVSYLEFRRALKHLRHPEAAVPGSPKLLELFMALDIKNNGYITQDEFSVLNMLSSRFQLERVVRVREFLQERFGSLKSAFKAMDENRSGSLSQEEWMHVMRGSHGYPIDEDVKVCFQFLDKDASNSVGSKEFEFLNGFDHEAFLKQVQAFADQVFVQYGSIESAYEAFDTNARPGKAAQAQGLEPKEFLSGCKRCGWQGSYDPRLLYNYLDASHVGCVSLTEFRLLTDLDAAEVLEMSADIMHKAVATFKEFSVNFIAAQNPDAAPESHWAFLHEEIRAVAQEEAS